MLLLLMLHLVCFLVSVEPINGKDEVVFDVGNGGVDTSFYNSFSYGINYEVAALMAIKSSLHDPYNVLDNWDSFSIDPCSWRMVTCSSNGFCFSFTKFGWFKWYLSRFSVKDISQNSQKKRIMLNLQAWSTISSSFSPKIMKSFYRQLTKQKKKGFVSVPEMVNCGFGFGLVNVNVY